MTSKTIVAGLVILSIIAGSVATQAIVFADVHDEEETRGLVIEAMYSIADAINGIEPNVTVEPTPIQIIAPQGEQGEQGIQGIQGIPGESSQIVTYLNISEGVPLLSGAADSVGTSCDNDDLVLSGGYSANNQVTVAATGPLSALSGWNVQFFNLTEDDHTVYVYALCLSQ